MRAYDFEDFEYNRAGWGDQIAPQRYPVKKRCSRKRRRPLCRLVLALMVAAFAFTGMGLAAWSGVERTLGRTDCPQVLLDALENNPEMKDFVRGYASQHQNPPAETLSESLDTVPLLLQWDERWGYQEYGSSMIALSGCAPTCVAMVAAYLTGDPSITPYSVAQYAEQQGYYVPGKGTSWELLHTGTQALGVTAAELPLSERRINDALDAGNPVICSMLPGDFTTEGHFIVLYGREAGGYLVRDPNSIERSEKVWYYETLSGQIGNLWACTGA